MLDGEQNAEKLADLCRGRLRDKIPEMQLALEGRMSEHHRWVLRLQRKQLEFLEAQIAKLDQDPREDKSLSRGRRSMHHHSRDRSGSCCQSDRRDGCEHGS